jgi:hypothetical protein
MVAKVSKEHIFTFDTEDIGDMFFWNVGNKTTRRHIPEYRCQNIHRLKNLTHILPVFILFFFHFSLWHF